MLARSGLACWMCIMLIYFGAGTPVVDHECPFEVDNTFVDIETNVVIVDHDTLQLQVWWNDTLPNGTRYNVWVTPTDPNKCSESPCSANGIEKPTNDVLLMPENSLTNLELIDCAYMFDCNYTMILENSNSTFSRRCSISIPYCVMEVCSCQHAAKLPGISIKANVTGNSSINLNWSINLDGFPYAVEGAAVHNDVTKAQMHIKINEQTNPHLAWGGKLKTIADHLYDISSIPYILTGNRIGGEIVLHLEQEITPNAVLNLNAFLIDALKCPGPDSLAKIKALPPENKEDSFYMGSTWFIVGIFLLMVIFLAVIIAYSYCYRTQPVKMQDNLNYVSAEAPINLTEWCISSKYELPEGALTLGRIIGEGNFGCVYHGYLSTNSGPINVAVKELKNVTTSEARLELMREIDVLYKLGGHENIIGFFYHRIRQFPFRLIMEYAEGGDLKKYLLRVREESKIHRCSTNTYISLNPNISNTYTPQFHFILDTAELNDFAVQIANGMRFLESKGICHRDLAARNILINREKILKISDFGLSRETTYITQTQNRLLPWAIMAIESITNQIFTHKSDVWAYGVVLWEIGTLGDKPYENFQGLDQVTRALLNGVRLPKPRLCSAALYSLMLQCWHAIPASRPSFQELYDRLSLREYFVHCNSDEDLSTSSYMNI